MIDWLSCRIPLDHEPLPSGCVIKIKPTGEKEWESRTWLDVDGSHDANIRVRSYGSQFIDFTGNPTKWLQGHNLFGVDDAQGLLTATMLRVLPLCGVHAEPAAIAAGCAQATLTRVDCTYSYTLGSRSRVKAWIRAAEASAHLRHRGRGTLTKEGTLYFGKESRRWSLKFYCKGEEIQAAGHKLPLDLPFRASLCEWAEDKLRVELVMRGMELREANLSLLSTWGDNTASDAFDAHMEGLTLTEQLTLTADVLEDLPPRCRAAYQLWRDGHDLREMFPRPTFYRYRAALLPHGVDIAVKQPRDRSRDVVQLGQVLRAEPATIPSWAFGTPALFEPTLLAA